ncbi:cell cycle control protein [Histoplasma capsulatum var. duboisii H88]|uniref:Cell cycle control protein n=1 Tax=Ajellomyces capsulatus (strain H88) TaxID=544711 RepID=F0UV60_AJEC8|nr:cell cycle control protein [Histoplasma capsulatum var. duboisii H88]QSS50998.1 cell cycle control protein [Histoplasma capsulatum var. duboisii H88]
MAGDKNTPLASSSGLPFPTLKKSHILHCSYHYWHPKYRSVTPKARLIPLNAAFLNYLRADGIILPPQDENPAGADDDSGIYSLSDGSDSDDDDVDPSIQWQEIHAQIKATIEELGGKVAPKLNWSAPKDATWISATNDMQCRTPNDIYLLLKSSDFVTHDLEHAFDGCVSDTKEESDGKVDGKVEEGKEKEQKQAEQSRIPYHLALRKYITLNPSLEFRCFVRDRKLLCLCQRDLNHFNFLFGLRDNLRDKIQTFFDIRLRDTFPDPDFVFDVYVPPPHNRVWLMDINPFALRTDPLLFSWLEILNLKVPSCDDDEESDMVRVEMRRGGVERGTENRIGDDESEGGDEDDHDDATTFSFVPEFRLVEHDDPEAYGFATPRYSAHKLPRDVVDASRSGPGGMSEFLGQWQDILAKRIQEDEEAELDVTRANVDGG